MGFLRKLEDTFSNVHSFDRCPIIIISIYDSRFWFRDFFLKLFWQLSVSKRFWQFRTTYDYSLGNWKWPLANFSNWDLSHEALAAWSVYRTSACVSSCWTLRFCIYILIPKSAARDVRISGHFSFIRPK